MASCLHDLPVRVNPLVAEEILPADVIRYNQHLAEAAVRPWTSVFTHGDLHIEHVFVDDGEITGIID